MPDHHTRRHSAVAVIIGVGLAGTGLVPQAAATPAGLSIALTDPAAQARSHSSLTYTARLTNSGTDLFTGRLVLTVPVYLTITGASGGTSTPHTVTWAIDVPAGGAFTRTATARIGAIPRGTLHVTSLATVYRGTSAANPALIRAAHADKIAGVTDPPAPASRPAARHHHAPNLALTVLPVAGAALLLGGGAWLWRRRRSGQRAAPDADPDQTARAILASVGGTDTHHGA
jgi:LPXTG-motif cell wall-anchored protein